MARRAAPWLERMQYVAARTVAGLAATANPVDATALASRAARAWYGWDRRHADRAREHVRLAFPEATPEWVEVRVAESFAHLAQLAVEACVAPRFLTPDTWQSYMRLGRMGEALELLNGEDPVLLVTGHAGNWELLGFVLALVGYRIDALARPLDNPWIDRWLRGIRERRGLRVLEKFDATGEMMRVLDRGGTLGFVADQDAGPKGLFVPYFGRLASTYKSIGLLAVNRRIPIVCGGAQRLASGLRYELHVADVIRPEEWESYRDPVYYVTARYMRAIETLVRRRPGQYLWMHRRWKSRPRFERRGTPVPASLQSKIEGLPWIGSEERARLIGSERRAVAADHATAPA